MPMRVEGSPPASWTPRGPPPLVPAPTHFVFLQKNPPIAQTRVLAHLAAIFDLLAQSSIHKTALGDWSLVSRRPSGLRKTTNPDNSLAHRTTWLRSDFARDSCVTSYWIDTLVSRRPSGLRKTTNPDNSLAHRTTWLRVEF